MGAVLEQTTPAGGGEPLLGLWGEVERLRRRLPSVEHQLVLEAEGRGLPESVELRGVAQLLRGLLRLDPREAGARVRAAHAAGIRRSLTGQPVPALFPQVAAAQAEGSISERHARIVQDTIDKLPDPVREQCREQVEAELVGHARVFDPIPLGRIAERLAYCYDPDGRLDDVDQRAQQRGLNLRARVDGSAQLSGELTAELAEYLQLHFDSLAKPVPATDAVNDPRTAGQRRHDALLEALKLNVRARQLPTVTGVTSTVVVTMTQHEFETRKGLARTSHGALIPVPEAMRIAAADYRLMNVVIDKTKAQPPPHRTPVTNRNAHGGNEDAAGRRPTLLRSRSW